MAPHPEAELLQWAGGEHPFFLRVGELRTLQKRCGDVGPLVIYGRLASSLHFTVDDVIEPIRLGLIGGSNGDMSNMEAGELIKQFVTDRRGGYIENAPLAAKIIHYSIIDGGNEHDPVGKPQPDLMPGMTQPPIPEAE